MTPTSIWPVTAASKRWDASATRASRSCTCRRSLLPRDVPTCPPITASGEMSRAEFVDFLKTVLGNAARVSREGAVHFVCIDWKHVRDLVEAGADTYGAYLNLVVWNKTNAGQGGTYRNQHELIGVFRV